MATLMDTIKNQLSGEPPKKTELGQTERAQTLLSAKLGKAPTADSGPARSVIQEKSAAQTANMGLAQQSLADRLQGEQIKQADISSKNKEEEAGKNLLDMVQQYSSAFERETDNLLRDFERDSARLEDTKDAAKTEQLGFLLRLQDQDYITKLQQEGQMDRFNNSMAFKEEAVKQALADNKSLLDNQLAFDMFMGASDREFKEQLGQMDISFARSLADTALTAQKNQAIFSGIGTAVGAGADYYAKKSPNTLVEDAAAPPKQ